MSRSFAGMYCIPFGTFCSFFMEHKFQLLWSDCACGHVSFNPQVFRYVYSLNTAMTHKSFWCKFLTNICIGWLGICIAFTGNDFFSSARPVGLLQPHEAAPLLLCPTKGAQVTEDLCIINVNGSNCKKQERVTVAAITTIDWQKRSNSCKERVPKPSKLPSLC